MTASASGAGPLLALVALLKLQILVHTGMGPGGVMYRTREDAPWTSLAATASYGADRMAWPGRWEVGNAMSGPNHMPFRGQDLAVRWHAKPLKNGVAA